MSATEEILHDIANDDDIKEIMKSSERIKSEKRKITKNLLIICFAFLLNFIAFNGTSSLQSSLNYEGGLGTSSQAIIYGSLTLSALFTPSAAMKHFGCKWSICVSIVGYSTYPLANFYPTWWTLVPSSVIVGVCAAPLWTAKSTYLTTAANRYAKLTKEEPGTVVNRFFGMFFLIFQLNQIVGQLISSFVLSSGYATNLSPPTCYNSSYIETYCGSHDCQQNYNDARISYNTSDCPITPIQDDGVGQDTLYTLMGVYAAAGFLGAIAVGIFVDSIELTSKLSQGALDLFISTFQHLKDFRQVFLITISIYFGLGLAFFTGDFTRSFVSCPLAVNWVGFVMICYGASGAVFSYLFGLVQKRSGRIPLFTIGFLIQLVLIIVFQLWKPYPSDLTLFFLIPPFWAIGDTVWQTGLTALYGVLFEASQGAAFSNLVLWRSVGSLISFSYQSYLCVSTKLWILIGFLLVGMGFYYAVEYTERRKQAELKLTTSKAGQENRRYDDNDDITFSNEVKSSQL